MSGRWVEVMSVEKSSGKSWGIVVIAAGRRRSEEDHEPKPGVLFAPGSSTILLWV